MLLLWHNLSQTIYSIPWSFSTSSKQKTLGISNLNISRFCIYRPYLPVLWAVLLSYLEIFSKFPKLLLHFFFFQISIFWTPASTIAAIVPATLSTDSQILFSFFLFFLFLNRIFWFDFIIKIFIKLLFKYHFTENHWRL